MVNKKIKKITVTLLAALFWLGVWELTAFAVDLGFIIPRVGETVLALLSLVGKASFWKSVSASLFRVLLGFVLGVIIGILLAFLCNKFYVIHALISPIMKIIKATPVASFILVLWFLIGSESVPVAIALLMVAPIIWQNLIDGFASIDNTLDEVCSVFQVSYLKKLKILIVPTLLNFLLPALVSACGLAWKSGIAAEIITYTENSLGRDILNAKNYFESAEMFALTIVVILLSILIEKLLRLTVKAVRKA